MKKKKLLILLTIKTFKMYYSQSQKLWVVFKLKKKKFT